jgi:mycoredoxin-dependent peroxiredoxin
VKSECDGQPPAFLRAAAVKIFSDFLGDLSGLGVESLRSTPAKTPRREVRRGNLIYHGFQHVNFAITTLGGFMPATIGAPAPEFALKDQTQKEIKLSDYRGKKNVVIIFYPLDWSPVCTNEHACIVNGMKQFEDLDAQVLGLSVDSVWSHKAYAEKMGIQYPLLADFQPRGAVAAQYGVYLADKGITGRAISIIDRKGNLAWHKNYDIPVVPDIDEVSKALAAVK